METYVVEVEKLVCIKGTVTIDAVNPQEAEDMTIQRINSKELTVFSDDIEWDYYENEYFKSDGDISVKLFAKINDYTFYLPYYMIIVCEHIKKYTTGILMYRVIFKRKSIEQCLKLIIF